MLSSLTALLSKFGITPWMVATLLILLIIVVLALIIRITIQIIKTSRKKVEQLNLFFKEARKEIDASDRTFKDPSS